VFSDIASNSLGPAEEVDGVTVDGGLQGEAMLEDGASIGLLSVEFA
jgi:hypothetical protein